MDKRTAVPGAGKRIGDYVQTKLLPVPSPQRDQPMTLDDLIGPDGTKQIQTAGSITFHTVGDTGHENGLVSTGGSTLPSQISSDSFPTSAKDPVLFPARRSAKVRRTGWLKPPKPSKKPETAVRLRRWSSRSITRRLVTAVIPPVTSCPATWKMPAPRPAFSPM